MNSYRVCLLCVNVHLKVSKADFEPNGKRGQKYCFDENANECKGKNPHCSMCHVLQLAKSPLWYSPCKRRTKSEIQPSSQGHAGHAESPNNWSLWLTENKPWSLVIIQSKRNVFIRIMWLCFVWKKCKNALPRMTVATDCKELVENLDPPDLIACFRSACPQPQKDVLRFRVVPSETERDCAGTELRLLQNQTSVGGCFLSQSAVMMKLFLTENTIICTVELSEGFHSFSVTAARSLAPFVIRIMGWY